MCRNCSQTFSFAELSANETTADLTRPPKGVWFREAGSGFELGSSARSAAALFLIPFTLFWGGLSMGGIYGSQIAKGKFDLTQSLFGIPFLVGSVILTILCLMTTLGKVVVRGLNDQGSIFVGVGSIGWTRRFRWSEIKSIRESLSKWQQNGRNLPLIELNGPKPIRFGTQLTEERRAFFIAALRKVRSTQW